MWTKEWPTETGLYWFYGILDGKSLKKRLHFIFVLVEGTYYQYSDLSGVININQKVAVGHWALIEAPSLPDE